jgi:hypothetical protein
MGFREWTGFVGLGACRRWRIQEAWIEAGIPTDQAKPSGKPYLSVVGVPGFSSLVSGSSASVGVHDCRSVIMEGGPINRGIMPAEAQHPISTIGHDPCGR